MTLRLSPANRPSSLLQDPCRRLRYIEVSAGSEGLLSIFLGNAKEAGAVFTHGPGLRKQKNCMFRYSMRQGM